MITVLEWFGLPMNAAAHGQEIDKTLAYVHILMLVLFVGWGAFFVYTLWRFRASRSPKADYLGVKGHTSSYLEVAVAGVEAVLLLGFSIPLWAERVAEFPDEKEAVVVDVIGMQFQWYSHYAGPDGVFGIRSAEMVSQSNPVGLDRASPGGADDVVSGQLYLPVDKPAIIRVSSLDVIHSFSLPEMRVKQDAIPGMSIPLWFIPQVTTEEMRKIKVEKGDWDPNWWDPPKPIETLNYEIACAQLCGLGHYRMRGIMMVVTEEEFDAWMDEEVKYALEEEGGGEEEEEISLDDLG